MRAAYQSRFAGRQSLRTGVHFSQIADAGPLAGTPSILAVS
jgi:hypothetical protein